jgi:Fic family protein
MDRQRFGSEMTGRLVSVSIGKEDCAFIPLPLPRTWHVPLEIWPRLAEAKESLARLDGIGRTLPDPDLLLRPLQSREALRSSSLEGTYVSAEELLLFELGSQEPIAASERQNDWREVYNYAAALRRGTELLDTLPLSLRLIREMHSVLLNGVRGRDRGIGEFRQNQVHLGSDRRYVPPPPNELMACLDDFENFLNESDGIDPLIRTFMGHYQFEAIHPFLDGNGRVGRALLSLTAFKWCGLSRPWLYVSPFFDRHKDDYISALFSVSADGDWRRWFEICLLATIDGTRDSIQRCGRLVSLRNEYHSKADVSGVRLHPIIEGLFSNPILRITDVAQRLKVSYPTAKADIEKLVKHGILVELPGVYPKAFYCREIFNAAYSED